MSYSAVAPHRALQEGHALTDLSTFPLNVIIEAFALFPEPELRKRHLANCNLERFTEETIDWKIDFEASLRSLVYDAPRNGVTMIDDIGEVYINQKVILGEKEIPK